MSLGCVALVSPTLLTFIKYYSNTHMDIQVLLYFGSIRMNILMLDTRNVEQTKDVRMYT